VNVLVHEGSDESSVDARPAAHLDRAVPESDRAEAEARGERGVEDGGVVDEDAHAAARLDAKAIAHALVRRLERREHRGFEGAGSVRTRVALERDVLEELEVARAARAPLSIGAAVASERRVRGEREQQREERRGSDEAHALSLVSRTRSSLAFSAADASTLAALHSLDESTDSLRSCALRASRLERENRTGTSGSGH